MESQREFVWKHVESICTRENEHMCRWYLWIKEWLPATSK